VFKMTQETADAEVQEEIPEEVKRPARTRGRK
jgi:hypothetical protein